MWFNRHKSLSTAILVGLISLLMVIFVIIPIYKNASEIQGKIKVKSSELDSLTNKVSILSQLDTVVLTDRVKVLDSALPPKKDILLYLNSIDGLSKELGLTFGGLSLAPGEITEATGSAKKTSKPLTALQSLDTEIKLSGTQESVYTFLRTIEGVLPLMQIKNINVSVLSSDQYSLSLTLGMLWAEPTSVDVKGPVTLFGAEEDKYFNQLSGYRKFETTIASLGTSDNKQDLFAPFNVSSVNVAPSSSSSATTN